MSDDLATRLLAAIGETESCARMATDGPWQARSTEAGWCVDVDPGTRGYFIVDPSDAPAVDIWHIALHDPQRELRRCAADRRIVMAHNRYHECIELTGSGDRSVFNGKPWELWEPRAADDVRDFCFVIRSLAEGYGITTEETT